MITYIVGNNTYRAQQSLADILTNYTADQIERRDASELTPAILPDLFQGVSLFAAQRAVVIREPGGQKQLWTDLEDWLPRIAEETHVILLDATPDKRTRTFKALQQAATVIAADDLNEVQTMEWLKNLAREQSGELPTPAAKLLIEYVGLDQWRLAAELEKLLLVGDPSVERIKATVEATPQANAFALLDAALSGKAGQLPELLKHAVSVEDPFRLFGLLVNQIFQLAVVAAAEGRTAEAIAKDLGVHPYPIKKLQATAKRLPRQKIASIVGASAQLDDQLKRTVADPWLLIEAALMKIAAK